MRKGRRISASWGWLGFFELCTMLLLSFSAQAAVDYSQLGVVAYWPFDGDSQDKSGNGNTGTWNGGGFAAGRFGQGYQFSAGQFYQVNGSATLRSFNQGTLAAWFQPSAVPPDAEALLGKGSAASPPIYYLEIHHENGGGFRFYGINDAGQGISNNQAVAIPGFLNNWHHLAVTYDGQESRSYLDGVLVRTDPASGGVNTSDGEPFYINRHNFSGWSSRASGVIDDAVVFNRALSPAEIALLAQDQNANGVADFWETSATTRQPRSRGYFATGAYRNKIYVFGGGDSSTGWHGDVDVYDVTTGRWSAGTTMPIAVGGSGVCLQNNKFYLCGGGNPNEVDAVQIYSPATDSWTTGNPMPRAQLGFPMAVLNDKAYSLGAVYGTSYHPDVDAYDIAGNFWSTVPLDLPGDLGHAGAETVGNRIYVFGGVPAHGTYSNLCVCYEEGTNSWTPVTTMSTATDINGASVFHRGEIYAFGGATGLAPRVTQAYNPLTNQWRAATPLPAVLRPWGAEVVGDSIYVVAWDDTQLVVYRYTDLLSPTTPNTPANVSPTSGAAGVSLTPTLQSSAFSDPVTTETHAASQWQISTANDFTTSPPLLWDSGADTTHLTSVTPPASVLRANTTYWWRVCHQDNTGIWSAWSAATSFTTQGPWYANYNFAARGVVGYWPLDGNTYDYSGNNLHADAYGPTPTVGRFAGGYQFGGNAQYLSTHNNTLLNGAPALSVACWVKTTDGDYAYLVTRHYSDTIGVFGLGIGENKTYSWVVVPSGQVNSAGGRPQFPPIADSTFHHLCLVFDGATVKQYTDGILDGSFAATGPVVTNNLYLLFGVVVDATGLDQPSMIPSHRSADFVGTMDEVVIFNRALSAGEVAALASDANGSGVPDLWEADVTQPSNVSPTSGATNVSLTPTLVSSAFADAISGHTHAASQWQIATANDFTASPPIVWDSGPTTADLTAITVPAGVLQYNATYWWRVRHQDNTGAWSEWSVATSFRRATAADYAQLTPISAPIPFGGGVAVYDPDDDWMVVFGGRDASYALLNSVYVFDLVTETWYTAQCTGTGPDARYGAGGIYDGVGRRMVLFGGAPSFDTNTWALNFPNFNWSNVSPSGGPPGGRDWFGCVLDSRNRAMIITGGEVYGQPAQGWGNAWRLGLSANEWEQLNTVGNPSGYYASSIIYKPPGNGSVVFFAESHVPDTWSLDLGTLLWTNMAPGGDLPQVHYGHQSNYRPTDDSMYIFGGAPIDTLNYTNDLYALDFSANTWRQVIPTGAVPPARGSHMQIYDSARDRLVVFGGRSPGVDEPPLLYNDTWIYEFSTNCWRRTVLPPVGYAPVAMPDAYVVDEDTTLVVPAPGVLGNDIAPGTATLTASLVSGVSHGALTLNSDGSFTYAPQANFNGTDGFTYRAGVQLASPGSTGQGGARLDAPATDAIPTLGVGLLDSQSQTGDVSVAHVKITVKPIHIPPAAPSNLAAAAVSANQINISWTDNSPDETGFKIERKTGLDGLWREVAAVPANTTTYFNAGLQPNTPYYYRVRAYKSMEVSSYSNEASTATPDSYLTPLGQIGGECRASYVVGDRAYIGEGPNLRILDISSSVSIVPLGRILLPEIVEGLFVSGSTAYVADGNAGLQIVDVTNTATPTLVSTYDTPGVARRVCVSGGLAYVADGPFGLQIIDVSNPSEPTIRGYYDTPGEARAVFVSGNLAYVADDAAGLQVIDVLDPAAPVLRGFYDTPGLAQCVYVSGGLAYVADESAGVQILDVSNPAAPTLRGSYDTPGTAYDVWVSGTTAYVADGTNSGLQVLDVTNPAAPAFLGACALPGSANYVGVVFGGRAYVSCLNVSNLPSGGFRIVDVSNSAVPMRHGSYDTPGLGVYVFVSGTHAYVAGWTAGALIYDVRNPFAPRLAGSFVPPGTCGHVFVSGNLAYVTDSVSGLSIVDVSNPAAPMLVGGCPVPGSPGHIRVSGGYAYVTAGAAGGLQIVDVTSPTAPRVVGSCGQAGTANGVHVSGNMAYIADTQYGNLWLVDVSNPAAPFIRSTCYVGGPAFDVRVLGSYAYVAAYTAGLQVVDVSNPNAPRICGSYPTPDWSRRLNLGNGMLYRVDMTAGLQVLDVTNPAAPTFVASYDTPGLAIGIYPVGDLVYEYDQGAGLTVFRYSGPQGLIAPDHLAATALSASQINLAWSDNSDNEDGFRIERKIGAAGVWTEITTTTANARTYSDGGLPPNANCYYRVRGYNATLSSPYSNEVLCITTVTPPAAPSNLTAAAVWVGRNRIDLSWTDNSDNEEGFKIERKLGSGGAWSQIATLPFDVAGYQNFALPSNTSYYYRVRAFNVLGDSPYSGETSATTPNIVHPPIANGDVAVTNEDTPVTINVLANDTQEDGQVLSVAAFASWPTRGSIVVNPDNTVAYTPYANLSGSDAFDYVVSNEDGATAQARVTVTINAVNDPPVAANDMYYADADAMFTVGAPGVLGNDSDVDGGPLSAVLVTPPPNGTLTLNRDGSFIYVPNPGFGGSDSFAYVANDGVANSAPATVTVMVDAVPQSTLGFCTNWLLLGLYGHRGTSGGGAPGANVIRMDYLTDGAGTTERWFVPRAGTVVNTNYGVAASAGFTGGKTGYTRPTVFTYRTPSGAPDLVDYRSVFDPYAPYGFCDYTMCYAWTYAENKTGAPLNCFVGVASDDSIQVVLNGVEVSALNVGRGYSGANYVQNAWRVNLNPGLNLVMVKTFNGGGGFGFRLRFQTNNATGLATEANAVPQSQVAFVTAGPYAYPPVPPLAHSATANRTINTVLGYQAGVPLSVEVRVTTSSGHPDNVRVREWPPEGWAIGAPSVTLGSAAIETTTTLRGSTSIIKWDVGGLNASTSNSACLRYTVTPPVGTEANAVCTGTVTTDAQRLVGRDRYIFAPSESVGIFDWTGDVGDPFIGLRLTSQSTPSLIPVWFGPDAVLRGDPWYTGRTSYDGAGKYTVTACGADIWDDHDRGRLLAKRISGDFILSGDIIWTSYTMNQWCKAQLMVRNTISPGSPRGNTGMRNYFYPNWTDYTGNRYTRTQRTWIYQWRDTCWGSSGEAGGQPAVTTQSAGAIVPSSFKLVRAGNVIRAYGLYNGRWIQHPGSGHAVTGLTADPVLACLAVTSHVSGSSVTAEFSNVSISPVPLTTATRSLWDSQSNPTLSYSTQPITVKIFLKNGGGAASLMVRDFAPTRWTILDSNPPGVVDEASTITFTLPDFNADTTLTYTLAPPVTENYLPGVFGNGFADDLTNSLYGLPIGGANTLLPYNVRVFQQGRYPLPSYAGCADAHIFMFQKLRNTGANNFFEEGDWGAGTDDNKIALIKFPLAGLSSATTVRTAKLRLYHWRDRIGFAGTQTVYASRLLRDWGEGSGNGADGRLAWNGEVNWYWARHNQQAWEIGGARGPTDMAPPESSAAVSLATIGTWVEWDVTAMVREWIRDPAHNYGLKLAQDPAVGAAALWVQGIPNFYSKEWTDPAFRPMLVISGERNNPPVAASQSLTTPQDTPLAVRLTASDPDGNLLAYRIVTPPAHGRLTGTAPNLTYRPAAGYYGADQFTFKATDGMFDSNVAPVLIAITPTGDSPIAPTGLAAALLSISEVNLSWTDNSANELGFKLERKTGAEGAWAPLATVGAGLTTYHDTGLAADLTYYYRVCSYNAVGDSPWSNETSRNPLDLRPRKPANLAPPADATGVNLTPVLVSSNFAAPLSGNTHGASHWQLRMSPGDYAAAVYDAVSPTELTNLTVPAGSLSFNTQYYWHVRHQDSGGLWSLWSNETAFVTTSPAVNHPPDTPLNLSPANGAADVTLAPVLTASEFSDADAGDARTASQWQLRTDTGGYDLPFFDSGPAGVNASALAVPAGLLAAGHTYFWHVRYRDSQGAWSDWSAETSFETGAVVWVSVPQGLRAMPGANSVRLTWQPSGDLNLAGYNLYRDTSADGAFAIRVNGVPITNTEYLDADLTVGATYWYRITAVTTDGRESLKSAAVSAQTGTTKITMPDLRGPAGSTVTLLVNLENANGVTGYGMDIRINYDPAVLTPRAYRTTPLTDSFMFATNLGSANGQLNFSGISGMGAEIQGEGHILDVDFVVTAGTPAWTTSTLAFAEVFLYDGMLNPIAVDYTDTARLTVDASYILGDLNGDGIVTSADAFIAQRIAIGQLVPTPLQQAAGDLNGDGFIDSADVTLILRLASGQSPSGTSGADAPTLEPAHRVAADEDYVVALGWVQGMPGQTVAVPVTLSEAAGLAGIDLQVSYDPTQLIFESAAKGSLTQSQFTLRTQHTLGQVVLTASASSALPGGGQVFILNFRIPATVNWSQSPLTITRIKLNGARGENLAWRHTVGVADGGVSVGQVTLTVERMGAYGGIRVDGVPYGLEAPLTLAFPPGAVVTVEAVDTYPGWGFAEWLGDLSGSVNPMILVLGGNKQATVSFSPAYSCVLQVFVSPGDQAGQVRVSCPAPGPEPGSYWPGALATLEALPSPQWRFVRWQAGPGWTGPESGVNPVTVPLQHRLQQGTAVFERIPVPEIGCAPTSLSMHCALGGRSSSATLVIWNTSAIGTLAYEIETTPTWLSCTPTSGSSTGQALSHTVVANPAGLAVGDYAGTITLHAAGAGNDPLLVPVRLHVRPTVVLRVGSAVSEAGATNCPVEVRLDNPTSVSKIVFTIADVPNYLTLRNVGLAARAAGLTCHFEDGTATAVVRLEGAGGGLIGPGEGSICTLYWDVAAGLPADTAVGLTIVPGSAVLKDAGGEPLPVASVGGMLWPRSLGNPRLTEATDVGGANLRLAWIAADPAEVVSYAVAIFDFGTGVEDWLPLGGAPGDIWLLTEENEATIHVANGGWYAVFVAVLYEDGHMETSNATVAFVAGPGLPVTRPPNAGADSPAAGTLRLRWGLQRGLALCATLVYNGQTRDWLHDPSWEPPNNTATPPNPPNDHVYKCHWYPIRQTETLYTGLAPGWYAVMIYHVGWDGSTGDSRYAGDANGWIWVYVR